MSAMSSMVYTMKRASPNPLLQDPQHNLHWVDASSRSDWLICDDGGARTIALQGSDSVKHWVRNVQFDPVTFLDHDQCLVHRGSYESALSMYDTLLQHVHAAPPGTRFRFTGHSIGGSIATLLMLLLLHNKELDAHDVIGTVTFGAPAIFCGNPSLVNAPPIHNIIMPYDIVPKVFACNTRAFVPLLERLNAKFRDHPCLHGSAHPQLYCFIGQMLALQADDAPYHPALPAEAGVFQLDDTAIQLLTDEPHPVHLLQQHPDVIVKNHDADTYVRALKNLIIMDNYISDDDV